MTVVSIIVLVIAFIVGSLSIFGLHSSMLRMRFFAFSPQHDSSHML